MSEYSRRSHGLSPEKATFENSQLTSESIPRVKIYITLILDSYVFFVIQVGVSEKIHMKHIFKFFNFIYESRNENSCYWN